MGGGSLCIVGIMVAVILCFNRASLLVWVSAISAFLIIVSMTSTLTSAAIVSLWIIFLILAVTLTCYPLRTALISKRVFFLYKKLKPSISTTEQAALIVGDIGWEGEIFSGMPNWDRYATLTLGQLSAEARHFLQDIVGPLCAMINDWEISQRDFKIPETIWQYLKKHHFFGLMIPKTYGGHAFSAFDYVQIITKISSVSTAVATVVTVPNSLGPAELLLHYGLDEQKDYYLPRLASGEEIPCFALTSPVAGSDASSIIDQGVIIQHTVAGQQQLAIKLNWSKRYITLSPIATLIGLAFKLYDPDHLLGDRDYIGITCALIPAKTPGVTSGRYHFPLHCAFPNGPIQGKDVLMSVDAIIGGVERRGQGWNMLMESLASGRGLSLPAMVRGSATRLFYATSAYARIREQFGQPIGRFGGVEEALAHIGGHIFLMEGLCAFTTSMVEQGIHSAVASGIAKYYTTEWSRHIVNAAMDVHGGKGICMGPKNYIAQSYIEMPISMTVEGANILMRSMVTFGQGILRCHPYLLKQIAAVDERDERKGIAKFDRALFAHMGFFLSNMVRTVILGLSHGKLTCTPGGVLKPYYRQLSRYSAAFSFISDVMIVVLGKRFKQEEKLSARLADTLSYLYIASAVMKYYESFEKQILQEEALCFVRWACDHVFYHCQESLHALLRNMPKPGLGRCLYRMIFPWGKWQVRPSDDIGEQIADASLNPTHIREYLSQSAYIEPNSAHTIGELSIAFKHIIAAQALEKKVYRAARAQLIKTAPFEDMIIAAAEAHILTEDEKQQVLKAYQWRMSVIHVDDFSLEDLVSL